MPEFPRKDFQLHVGWRTIKTAVSAMLVAIVYCLIGRNPAFACIGVIFGMGVDMQDSIKNGGNRLFGTLIGGVVLCIVLFSTPIESYMSYALNRIFDTAIGVIAALLVNYLLANQRNDRSGWEVWGGHFLCQSSELCFVLGLSRKTSLAIIHVT